MKALLQFEWRTYFTKPGFYVILFLVILAGVFAGTNFRLSVSPDVFKNAPYVIAYMLGLMSLLSIFFSTVLATQILFKEADANFNLILYATPIRKHDYLLSRFIAVSSLSFLCFTLFVTGFAIGQSTLLNKGGYTDFNILFYVQPLFVFGFVNTLFCSAIICSVAWGSKNKLMVYVTGLFIYILYMATLIFSGSPLMAKGMPQSATAVLLSASLDPFGLSAYFLQTNTWTVVQRNTDSIPLSGILLFNRLGVLFLSILSLFVTFKTFKFSVGKKSKTKKISKETELNVAPISGVLNSVLPSQSWQRHLATLCSFTRIDIKYITKSIPFVLTCIGLLFYLSMEIYGAIEKGIRLPQKYATSGLMAKTIIENFHGLCLIVILYYANEIIWRSKNSNYQLIENATPASSTALFFSKWITLSIIIFFFTTLMILLGIVFQMQYHYPHIDWLAYAGVYLFTSFPLVISAGIILTIQRLIKYKHVGLIVSSAIILFTATTLGSNFLSHPLLRFQIPHNGLYSDMNGFGSYLSNFGWLHMFGLCVIFFFVVLVTQFKKFKVELLPLIGLIALVVCSSLVALKIIKNYKPKNAEAIILAKAEYEKKYRAFQNQPQPTVTDIVTTIDLFPEENTYNVAATYTIQNKTTKPIDSILVNFADGIVINETSIAKGNRTYPVKNQYTIIQFENSLLPGDSAKLTTKFSYSWSAINGHQSLNAILQNGSFMRISRYYPTFGYLSNNEIESEVDRKKFNLGLATPLVTIDAPKNNAANFSNLDMIISTSTNQTAIGIGELVKQWRDNNRNYFQYKTLSPVPFRFAVSSAEFAVKKASYKGKNIEVYYHPQHYHNVDHLLKNAQLTLEYCETNFGAYPFTTIRFAEVSAFTRGFAATAYPTTIYMTENMIFNANIGIDKKQDVINELAGHELAHLWWGNSQISPDNRVGDVVLTETLAMYTELMLSKKMHGNKRVMENVNLHLGMYLDERGFTEEQPLFKMVSSNVHLSYSKSLVVMYQLAELIGEEKVNLALRQLLKNHAYPNASPISTDFINELYAITDTVLHLKIDDLFKRITLYDFNITNTVVKKIGIQYELTINGVANKYYEDGKGGKTKVSFNDSVDTAIQFKNDKEKIITLSIINNTITGKILLTQIPVSIVIDPDVRFIKLKDSKKLIIPETN
jgi:ABC-2 type transport system permease protein